jgi:glyoxylase-like metal-dependent hydrolase (beta-lactamase superfamily II)
MKIDIVKVGYLETNCYILDIDNHVLVIDPGDEFDKINTVINNRVIDGVLITHGHFDHVGALDSFKKNTIHDYYNLDEGIHEIGKFKFDVIYTPGHKEDSVTFYFKEDKVMFVGDFIFKDSIGRTDLPGGNTIDMLSSINKIKKYDDDIKLYPGHGPSTSLGYEKKNNIYFNMSIE